MFDTLCWISVAQLVFSPSVHDEVKGMVVGKRKIGSVLLVFLRLCCYKESATKGRKNTYEQKRKKFRWESSSPAPDLLSDNSLLACKPLSLHLGLFLLNPREEERSLADQAKTTTEQLTKGSPRITRGCQPLGLGPVTPVHLCVVLCVVLLCVVV